MSHQRKSSWNKSNRYILLEEHELKRRSTEHSHFTVEENKVVPLVGIRRSGRVEITNTDRSYSTANQSSTYLVASLQTSESLKTVKE